MRYLPPPHLGSDPLIYHQTNTLIGPDPGRITSRLYWRHPPPPRDDCQGLPYLSELHSIRDSSTPAQQSRQPMPICINCRLPLATLYTTYSRADDRSLGKGVRLTQCPRCKRFADKYVEHDFVVLFIDLVLIKPQVYRHLLFNRLGGASGSNAGKSSASKVKRYGDWDVSDLQCRGTEAVLIKLALNPPSRNPSPPFRCILDMGTHRKDVINKYGSACPVSTASYLDSYKHYRRFDLAYDFSCERGRELLLGQPKHPEPIPLLPSSLHAGNSHLSRHRQTVVHLRLAAETAKRRSRNRRASIS